jgi:DNA polymerase-3 subunit delta
MKISNARADGFAAAPDPDLKAILVYGPDRGLVDLRFNQIANVFAEDVADPFQVSQLDGSVLKGAAERFWSEITAQSLSGARRVVLVRDSGDSLVGDVGQFLASPNDPRGSAMLLLQAGELGPRSKLRKLFDTANNAASLACYPYEGRALSQFVAAEFAKHGVTAERTAIDYLIYSMGENHALRMGEIEKLALYAGDGGTLGMDDVVSCVTATAEVRLSGIAYAVGAGDLAGIDRHIARSWQDGVSPIAVLRSVVGHFQTLFRAKQTMSHGVAPDQAIAGLRPPIFWKDRGAFIAQLKNWQVSGIRMAVSQLTEAEVTLKSTGIPQQSLCHRVLLATARIPKSVRRT